MNNDQNKGQPFRGCTMNDKQMYCVTKRNSTVLPFDVAKILVTLERVGTGCTSISIDSIVKELYKNIFDGITTADIYKALILSTVVFIEQDFEYDKVATRLLLERIVKEVLGCSITKNKQVDTYQECFIKNIILGVEHGLFDKKMLDFDLDLLAKKLVLERDDLFSYMGLQTLNERYFAKYNGIRVELPQNFWMRIAMGLALQESNKDERAIEFYEILSTMRYTPSTPTLFHSGFPKSQLSSCFLTTVSDDLGHIFKCIGDNAQLAKWAGGLGGDWTNVRATGSLIKSIKATSQGVIPFLKIANDVVVAITKSGIRRGGTCVYLETWHLDIEEFLDLRRNTGDERRRTHDMNTAHWIPDLFMKRVLEGKDWTLFSPEEVPELHSLYGKAFEDCYVAYEEKARLGMLRQHKTISAKQLWRKMLTRLFETGHPWITFKDPCNIRSPQDHCGVINSSNLCTEITLNTSAEETAVCNLGSLNIGRHIIDGKLDTELLADSIKHAIRMLDNVINLSFYATKEAENSNLKHRPIGLGLMGFQDALFKMDIAFSSTQALTFADTLMEFISYHAIAASCELARERGAYSSFEGSKWSRGIFPLDTLDLLEAERGICVEVSRCATLEWDTLKALVMKHGMRNSNVMAIAPTATISTITGCYPCIEPIYENIYVKSNVSGEFTIVNRYLVQDLKKLNLWNKSLLDQLKYHDGDLALMQGIPQQIKDKYQTCFEIDPLALIKLTAIRSKWIDQSQSHNVFLKGVSGVKLHEVYTAAWRMGLKTTYYLRTLAATQIEKSTLDAKEFGFTQMRNYDSAGAKRSCALDAPPDCESCQ
jgi:ribonucleoside-diphosphate reductase alpha chain